MSYLVNLNSDAEQKYFMTILCKDHETLDNEKANITNRVSFKANAMPTFSYYDSHCLLLLLD